MMRALTLWRPWHFAFLYIEVDPKRIENRGWKPWDSIIGKRIALHAGKHWDDRLDGHDEVDTRDPRCQHEGVVATAIVRGWIHVRTEVWLPTDADLTYSSTISRAEARELADSRWFFGPYGWVLDGIHALGAPIPCRGAQGLWIVPPEIEAQLDAAA